MQQPKSIESTSTSDIRIRESRRYLTYHISEKGAKSGHSKRKERKRKERHSQSFDYQKRKRKLMPLIQREYERKKE